MGFAYGSAARLSILLGLVLASTACQDDGQLTARQPRLTLSPEPGVIRWERVDATPMTQRIEVGNSGDAALDILDVALGGRDEPRFAAAGLPMTLGPGARAELLIDVAPTTFTALLAATLRLRTNDPERPEVEYALSASIHPRCVLIPTPATLTTRLDAPTALRITASGAPCRLVRVAVDERYFDLQPPFSGDLTLQPGETWALEVTQVRAGVPDTSKNIRFVTSEGPGANVVLVPARGAADCLGLEPTAVLFPGPMLIGQTSTRTIAITNDCDVPVGINGTAGGGSMFAASAPTLVEPFGRAPMTVTFTPDAPGTHRTQIMVRTEDPNRPELFASLIGEAEGRAVFVQPSALTFDAVPYQPAPDGISECGSVVRTLTIYNATQNPVTLLDLPIIGDDRFAVIGATVDRVAVSPYGLAIPAATPATVDLRFYPSRADPPDHQSILTVQMEGQEPRAIVLDGATAAPGAREERFIQSAAANTDVLFVVDQSGSMSEERALLERNLGSFLDQAARTASDLRIGLTTVDTRGPDAGRLHFCAPHPAYVDGDYADGPTRAQALTCALTTLPDGSSVETGLAAAVAAIEKGVVPPTMGGGNLNAGFIRSDANLAIVVVSDEDDQSPGTDTDIVARLRTLKGGGPGQLVRLHAIVGDPRVPGCTEAVPAPRYTRVAALLGGQVRSICRQDWDPILSAIGRAVVATVDRYPLAERAAPQTIRVTVGGVDVPFDAQVGFTYDRAANTVRLTPTASPAPGAEVVIRYEVACDP